MARRRRRWARRMAAGGALAALAALGALAWWARPVPPVEVQMWDLRLAVPARDVAAARAGLAKAAAALAGRRVVLAWAGQEWTYALPDLGVRLDAAALVAAAQAAVGAPGPPDAVRPLAEVDLDRLEAAVAPVAAAGAAEPVPARLQVSGGTVQVVPDRPGRRLDLPALAAALQAALQAGPAPGTGPWQPGAPVPPLRLAVPVLHVPARPSAPELAALGVRRVLARFVTYYDPSVPRGENVARAARILNGTLIGPGEIFSYNAAMGPVTAAQGWQPAPVIVAGQVVPGVGGGVCQTATTLYGAALLAGLEVLERHPHQLAVAYSQPSLDAAVAPGAQDLKLRNPGPHGVLIEAHAEGGTVAVAIWGDGPPDREYRLETAVTGQVPAPVHVVPDPALPAGAEAVVAPGHPGFRSVAYRVLYEGGRPVRREQLSADVYAPAPRVVRRGVGPGVEPAQPLPATGQGPAG